MDWFEVLSENLLEGTDQMINCLSQDSRSPGRVLNSGHPE